jgi:hypothetical protein
LSGGRARAAPARCRMSPAPTSICVRPGAAGFAAI